MSLPKSITNLRARSALLFAMLGCLVIFQPMVSATRAANASVAVPGNYCGVYCVYGACRVLAVAVVFPTLLKSRYVGSSKGSTFLELARAIRDHGLHATLIRRLNVSTLVHCQWPVILHVRSDVEQSKPNHFILYLGDSHGRAVIMDPPAAPNLVSFRDITALWDGKGIIVSNSPVAASAVFGYTYFQFTALAILLISLALVLRTLARRGSLPAIFDRRPGAALAQAAGIALLALLVGMFANAAGRGGLLASARQARELSRVYSGHLVPRIGLAQARVLVAQGVTVVDARLPGDFNAGHIPGAINIPPGTAAQSRRELLRGAGRASRIMVYCEDRGCPLAQMLANRMQMDGYRRVCVFIGGWRRWEAGMKNMVAPAGSTAKAGVKQQ